MGCVCVCVSHGGGLHCCRSNPSKIAIVPCLLPACRTATSAGVGNDMIVCFQLSDCRLTCCSVAVWLRGCPRMNSLRPYGRILAAIVQPTPQRAKDGLRASGLEFSPAAAQRCSVK